MIYRKNFVRTQNLVRISHGERANDIYIYIYIYIFFFLGGGEVGGGGGEWGGMADAPDIFWVWLIYPIFFGGKGGGGGGG